MIVSGALVLGGYASGAVQTLGEEAARPDYAGVAEEIEQRWSPGDVVVDASWLTPVPLTGLDVYLAQTHPEIRLALPISDKPFLPFDPVPPLDEQINEAISLGQGRSIFLVSYLRQPEGYEDKPALTRIVGDQQSAAGSLLRELPERFTVDQDTLEFPSLAPLALFEITDRRSD